MAISRDDVRWAYRILLERDPENAEVIDNYIELAADLQSLKRIFFSSPEFLSVNRSFMDNLSRFKAPSQDKYTFNGRDIVDVSSSHGIDIKRSAHEKLEIEFITKHVKEGDNFLDLGGGRGIFSIIAAACVGASGHVYSVESDQERIALIKRNVEENGVEQRVKIVDASFGKFTTVNEERVIGTALNNIFANIERINFIRMDLRGAEISALNVASCNLSRNRPLILAQIDPDRLLQVSGITWQNFLNFMAEHGYKGHILDESGLGKTHLFLESGQEYTIVFSTTRHHIR